MIWKIQDVLASSAKVVYSGGGRQVNLPQVSNAVRCTVLMSHLLDV